MTTILTEDGVRSASTHYHAGRPTVAAADLHDAIGWELKPEGLCQGDVCVPIKDSNSMQRDGRVELAAVADALGRPMIIDETEDLVVVGVAAETRRRALQQLELPDVSLPDLDGALRKLTEWRGRKKLLIAFSSW